MIEKEMARLCNVVAEERGLTRRWKLSNFGRSSSTLTEAFARLIEQHNAYRQEVSDAVKRADEILWNHGAWGIGIARAGQIWVGGV